MPDWAGVTMTWTGADGSTWDLLDNDSAVTLEGVRGLHLPAWDRYSTAAPGMAGSRHSGSRAQPREVRWTVAVHSRAGSDAWVDLDAAWWRSLDPDAAGTWAVTTRGATRTLQLRLTESDDDMPRDPTMTGDLAYGITLEAAQPFWQGGDVVRRFVADASAAFFATSGGVITLSAGNTLGVATMDNPGDEPAWPVWLATGPLTQLTVGLAGKTTVAPVTLAADEALVIDTRPDSQGATKWDFVADGADITLIDGTDVDVVGDLDQVEFAPVPRGTSVPLTVAATGTSAGFSLQATITPLYRRAW